MQKCWHTKKTGVCAFCFSVGKRISCSYMLALCWLNVMSLINSAWITIEKLVNLQKSPNPAQVLFIQSFIYFIVACHISVFVNLMPEC